MKGGLLLSMSQPDVAQGETCLVEAIELSRRQGARAWELRAATDLARLRVVQDRRSEARSLLQPVFDQFDDGFSTPDLRAAEQLLATLV
jgi:predicted ATPase